VGVSFRWGNQVRSPCSGPCHVQHVPRPALLWTAAPIPCGGMSCQAVMLCRAVMLCCAVLCNAQVHCEPQASHQAAQWRDHQWRLAHTQVRLSTGVVEATERGVCWRTFFGRRHLSRPSAKFVSEDALKPLLPCWPQAHAQGSIGHSAVSVEAATQAEPAAHIAAGTLRWTLGSKS
jgi:hypothetical protein